MVGKLLSRHRDWRDVKHAFTPRDLAEGKEFTYCPYCGSEFGAVNQQEARATRPEHGTMRIEIKQFEVREE